MAIPTDRVKQNLRLHFVTQLDASLVIKGRTELVWYNNVSNHNEEGFLSFVEVAGQLTDKLKGNLRVQYFETGSYDSRIYAYESDVLYSFSIPSFSDKGFRYYVNASYAPSKNLTLWFRLAQTYYPQKATIGSGLEEIKGNRKTEIKCQFKYNF
jgi:outer membrane receptor protein involved in Fe transport